MRTFGNTSRTETGDFRQLGRKIAKLGFWFFLIKGLLWLTVPFVLSYFALNS